MKKNPLLTICLLLMIFITACGQPTSDTSLLAPEGSQIQIEQETPQSQKYTIALVMKTLTNPGKGCA